jgi:uncharacterized protein (DUF58 family)
VSVLAGLVPRGRLLAALLVGAGLLALLAVWSWMWVAVLAYHLVLVGAAGVDLVRLPRRDGFTARRTLPRPLALGVAQEVQVEVRCERAAGLDAVIADHVPLELGPRQREVPGRFDRDGTLRVHYKVQAARRGAYALPALDVRVWGRGGWWGRQLRLPTADEARVYPDIIAVRRWELLMRRGVRALAGQRRARLPGGATTMAGLREYLPGDEMRRVNWKATARRDSPITTEVEAERGQQVLIAIDAGRLMTAPAGHLTKLDHAVNAALLLAWVAAEAGDRVGAMTFADQVSAYEPPRRGVQQVHRINELLYRVGPVYTEPEYADALTHVALRLRGRSLVILLTDVQDTDASGDLVAHALRLGARHLVLTVAMADPEVMRAVRRPITTPAHAYEWAAAEELLQTRRQAFETLQRGGVHTLDVEAGALSPALVERYLALKERGLV